jgi:hypothetical protein
MIPIASDPLSPEVEAANAQIMDMTYRELLYQRFVCVATKLGIPDILKDQELGSDEIARKMSMHPGAMYRFLRGLSSAGIVSELPERRFALTLLGSRLRSDVPCSMRGLVIFMGEPFYLRTWEQLDYSLRTGKPAFDNMHGMTFFDYACQHPEISLLFDEMLTSITRWEAQVVVNAFDFSSFHNLVDVAGGQGTLLTAILKVNPQGHGVLFDLPSVIDGARKHIEDEGLTQRCDVVAGDFFQAVSPGGDGYILKYIIHDWDEKSVVTILKNCRKAMSKNVKLLVIEAVVPPPEEPHYSKYMDVEMLLLHGGRERTLKEYETLLNQMGFKVTRMVPTEGNLSIIEAIPV